MPEPLYRFAEALRALLDLRSAGEIERRWVRWQLDDLGWEALHRAWQDDGAAWDRVLDECDGLLLRLLDRLPNLAAGDDAGSVHVRTFREPALERLQHATAAALVAQRYGVAGLRTVIADSEAPVPRRYFAFLAVALRHPPTEWSLFERYLTPDAHHAFLGAAAEAARFYPEGNAALRLVNLFDAVRDDLHLRAFLSPRILQSLYVLADPVTLPFFRALLVAGFTASDPERCEVTRALVMVRRFTGSLEQSSKYPDPNVAGVAEAVDRAEQAFERTRALLCPVQVI
ncbi:MAG: hypothetical protein A2W29_06800 [Gemmatimonadetes bacterium RBG_16_66_8]|nr:MAG: hypothetical protein A2W29_06800 [Gemmatimonadetes bacterium RBG_16_66_8]